MGKTTFVSGMADTTEDEEILQRKKDFKKIRKFLIRQTGVGQGKREENQLWSKFKSLSFNQYLREVGMFSDFADMEDSNKVEKAKKRYIDALTVGIKGNGAIFMKREPKDVFTNKF